MSPVDQLVSEVRRLLGLLTDIKVLRSRVSGETAILEIVSHSPSATLAVELLCAAANVSVESNASSDDSALYGITTWDLVVSTRGFDLVPHGYLQLLAIHLVWHLHAIGVIPEQAANALLDMWHGGRVGARQAIQAGAALRWGPNEV
ncbi:MULTISPECIES: hypothetical protein [Xanthomonas]|uniref:Uncharacterized protein n=2 Tax=Xanthomonas TaxID=338 RepID=A0A6N7QA75_9XANT|nr:MULTISPECIES: hypothetical protein [Xanthomonas]MRH01184.1 hypothetical protein [Xanthomonas sontii]MRH75379.1 hypothetical protein [Xanthomonas sontii]UYK89243.1 hypothetical protein NG824_01930 [Xanthomonas sacchari]